MPAKNVSVVLVHRARADSLELGEGYRALRGRRRPGGCRAAAADIIPG